MLGPPGSLYVSCRFGEIDRLELYHTSTSEMGFSRLFRDSSISRIPPALLACTSLDKMSLSLNSQRGLYRGFLGMGIQGVGNLEAKCSCQSLSGGLKQVRMVEDIVPLK